MSHPSFATLHPTGHHPETQERLRVLQAAFPEWREAVAADVASVERCHDERYVELVRSIVGPDVARRGLSEEGKPEHS